MNSVYKWKITKGSKVYYAYLLDDGNDSYGSPFIYAEGQRAYGTTWELGDFPNEAQISKYTSFINVESAYREKFESLNALIEVVLGHEYIISGDVSSFYDLDYSACGEHGANGGTCPTLKFKYVSVGPDEAGGAVITASGVTEDGTNWYEVTLSVPRGKQGERGEKGEQGTQGNKGDQGDKGEQGDKGADGVAGQAGKGRNVMAFLRVPKTDTGITDGSEIKPSTAENDTNGKYKYNIGEIEYPIVNGYEWGDSDECTGDSDCDVWMTCGNFEVLPENVSTDLDAFAWGINWSNPVKINGVDGDNGKDGNGVEFIYFLVPENDPHSDAAPDTPESADLTIDNDLPPVKYNGIDDGLIWQNHPIGISGTRKIEYMSLRTKTTGNRGIDRWGEWCKPAIWAKWGEDGIDGDGVEYIYAVTEKYDKSAIESALTEHINSLSANTEAWESPELFDWIRANKEAEFVEGKFHGWTDNPSDVSPSETYEWVSIRRRKWDSNSSKSYYEPFSTPALWAKWPTSRAIIDLTRETIGIHTGNDWVLDTNATLSTTVYAKSMDSGLETFTISVTHDSVNNVEVVTSQTSASEYKIDVKLSSGFTFANIPEHSFVVNIAATATTKDGEEIIDNLLFTVFAVQGGKEGEILMLEASCNSIIHDLETDTFIPSIISANVNYEYSGTILPEDIDTGETLYCVGEWSESNTGTTYTLGNSITLSSLTIDSGATFIRFKTKIKGVPLHCDVPIIPTGKSSTRGELSDTEFLIGTGGDNQLDSGPVSATSELTMFYGNEKIDYNKFHISAVSLYRGGNFVERKTGTTAASGSFNFVIGGNNSAITIDYAANTANNGKTLTFTVGTGFTLTEGYSIVFTLDGKYKSLDCEANVSYKILGLKDGEDGVFYLLRVTPTEILCTPDKESFLGTDTLHLNAVEVKGNEHTIPNDGVFTYTAYSENNNSVAIGSGQTNNTSTGATLVLSAITYNSGYNWKNTGMVDIRYYKTAGSSLYDNKTIFVHPLSESIGTADFDDDTWIISTGEDDDELDVNDEKTSNFNVWYGTAEANISGVTYEIKQGGSIISSSHYNYGKIAVSTSIPNKTATFTLSAGLKLDKPIDVVFNFNASSPANTAITFDCQATFTIAGVKQGKDGETYNILTNPSSIQKDTDRNYITTSIEAAVITNGGETPTGGTLYWKTLDKNKNEISGKSGSTTTLSGVTISSFTGATNAAYLLLEYKQGSALLDKETLPVISDGQDVHRVLLKTNPTDLTCSSDKQTFYETAVTVEAYDVVGSVATQLSAGTVSAITYDESGNQLVSTAKTFTSVLTSLMFNVDELSNNNRANLHRIELTYVDGTLFDIVTVYVYPVASSMAVADFVDDTWYISTGDDNILDVNASKASALNVYYGNDEFTGATVTNVKIMVNGSEIGNSTNNGNGSTVSVSGITVNYSNLFNVGFSLSSGTVIDHAIEILFTLSGQVTSDISFSGVTAKFVIAGLMEGADGENYNIIANPDAIKKSADGESYIDTAVTVSVSHVVGGTITAGITGGTIEWILYATNNSVITSGSTSLSSSSILISNWSANTISSNPHSLRLVYKRNGNVWDEETIPVLKDGKDGENGQSVGKADFDDETWIVSTGDDYKLDIDSPISKTVNFNAWYGIESATISNASYTIKQNGATLASGVAVSANTSTKKVTFTLSSGLDLEKSVEVTFTFTASYSTVTFYPQATFTIAGVRGGKDGESYSILTNPSSIQKNKNGNYTTTSVTAKVIDNKGDTPDSGELKWYVLNSSLNLIESNSGTTALSGGTITGYTGVTTAAYLKLEYTQGGVVLDRETLPVISDGKDGDNGKDGDFVENVYFVTNYQGTGYTFSIIATGTGVQNRGYIPKYAISSGNTVLEGPFDCSNVALEVSAEKKYRYISQRTYNGTTKTFGSFSTPKVDASFSFAELTEEQMDEIKQHTEEALGEQIEDIISDISGITGQINTIESSLTGYDMTLANLDSALTATQATVSDQGAEISTLKTDSASTNNALIELNSKFINSIVSSGEWKKDSTGKFVSAKWTEEISGSPHYVYYCSGEWTFYPERNFYNKDTIDENVDDFLTYINGVTDTNEHIICIGRRIGGQRYNYSVKRKNTTATITIINLNVVTDTYYISSGSTRRREVIAFYGSPTAPKKDKKEATSLIPPINNPLHATSYYGITEDYSILTTGTTSEDLSYGETYGYSLEKFVMTFAVPVTDAISQILQTSSSITQWVGSSEAAAQIAMGINGSDSSVLINADHIVLEGETIAENLVGQRIRSKDWDSSSGLTGFCLDGDKGTIETSGGGKFAGNIEISGDSSLCLIGENSQTAWEIKNGTVGQTANIVSVACSNISEGTAPYAEVESSPEFIINDNNKILYSSPSDSKLYGRIRMRRDTSNQSLNISITAAGGANTIWYVQASRIRFYIKRNNVKLYISDNVSFGGDGIAYSQATVTYSKTVQFYTFWQNFNNDNGTQHTFGIYCEIEGSCVEVNQTDPGTVSIQDITAGITLGTPIVIDSSDDIVSSGNRMGTDGFYIDFNDSAETTNTHFLCRKTETQTLFEMTIEGVGIRVIKDANHQRATLQYSTNGTWTDFY